MRLFLALALATGLASALTPFAERRKARRAQPFNGVAPFALPTPGSDAPEGYTVSMATPEVTLDSANLQALPADLIDRDDANASTQILESRRVLRKLRGLENRQITAADFYECRSASPAPTRTDCDTVVDQVIAAGLSLSVAENACLLFQYGTCWGFFCSLCATLTTTTDFIGSQLSTADLLCIDNGGQVGTVVGEDAPQWEAGFVYEGSDLPSYSDVC
ncbi:hypothetical protein F4778DRAFT_784276 [Xylariomycetidae sp. FL2044]|nr:hypothetical protein F4778DRAFT_784276 [Xylariomycetidae sp. FL2044]